MDPRLAPRFLAFVHMLTLVFLSSQDRQYGLLPRQADRQSR
jgi:hypothetical protein